MNSRLERWNGYATLFKFGQDNAIWSASRYFYTYSLNLYNIKYKQIILVPCMQSRGQKLVTVYCIEALSATKQVHNPFNKIPMCVWTCFVQAFGR